MGGAKKAMSKGNVPSSLKGSEGGQQRQEMHSLRSAGLAAAILCICTDEMATARGWPLHQAMLVLQAVSVDDAQMRMARIQPCWETLLAQSRMDLLSVPIVCS